MSRIEVDPESLEALSGAVDHQAGRAREMVAEVSGKASVRSGAGELDAALGGFLHRWRSQLMGQVAADERLARAITVAAERYRHTDATAISRAPHPGQTGFGSRIAR